MLRNRILLILLAASAGAFAQTRPATAPTTRHAMVIPPGFKLIESHGRRVLVEPADEPWARKAMADLAPATRPTTAPADLLDRLQGARPELDRRMKRDLALADDTKIKSLFDDTIPAAVTRYRDLQPPIYYLATTRERLLKLVRDEGWKDPAYYYNRASDDVMVDRGIYLAVERPMDDQVRSVLFQADAPPASRAAMLTQEMQWVERRTADELASGAQGAVHAAFLAFIIDEVLKPVDLKVDQKWFGFGLTDVLAARYTAALTGITEDFILSRATFESPRNPVKVATVDLLHPADLTVLRDRVVPFYLDAMRRKATAAMLALVKQGGDNAIPKCLEAVRREKPADGPALVALIKRDTGVDLTEKLTPSR